MPVPESSVALNLPPSLIAMLLPTSMGHQCPPVLLPASSLLDVTSPSGSLALDRLCGRGTLKVELH